VAGDEGSGAVAVVAKWERVVADSQIPAPTFFVGQDDGQRGPSDREGRAEVIKPTVVKALVGIGLTATVTLGAAACGSSSHSSTSPSVQHGAETLDQFAAAGPRPADNTQYDAILSDMASLHPFSSVQDFESYMNDGPGNANLASFLGLGSDAVPGSLEYTDFMLYSLWMVSHHVAPYAAPAPAPAPATTPAPDPAPAVPSADLSSCTAQALAAAMPPAWAGTNPPVSSFACIGGYALANIATQQPQTASFVWTGGQWSATNMTSAALIDTGIPSATLTQLLSQLSAQTP
jgi:hypothetical protein